MSRRRPGNAPVEELPVRRSARVRGVATVGAVFASCIAAGVLAGDLLEDRSGAAAVVRLGAVVVVGVVILLVALVIARALSELRLGGRGQTDLFLTALRTGTVPREARREQWRDDVVRRLRRAEEARLARRWYWVLPLVGGLIALALWRAGAETSDVLLVGGGSLIVALYVPVALISPDPLPERLRRLGAAL